MGIPPCIEIFTGVSPVIFFKKGEKPNRRTLAKCWRKCYSFPYKINIGGFLLFPKKKRNAA
jgi:hypothetical protein